MVSQSGIPSEYYRLFVIVHSTLACCACVFFNLNYILPSKTVAVTNIPALDRKKDQWETKTTKNKNDEQVREILVLSLCPT